MFWIRILHLLVAAILLWGSISYLNGREVPRIWYVVVMLLAIAAAGYHGYFLAKRFCNK